jgi:SulP family sulfate permease
MAYTQSIMYYKSGGGGKSSSLEVAFVTTVLFFIGPSIASFMPRCMAGTLLLHCGTDLLVEGVYDSIGKCGCIMCIRLFVFFILPVLYSPFDKTLSTLESGLLHWS